MTQSGGTDTFSAGARTASEALHRHQAETTAVLASADPAAIKKLYVDLGTDFWSAAEGDVSSIPVLSAPETTPVVVTAMAARSGIILDAGCGPNPATSLAIAARPDCQVVTLDIGWGTVRTARAIGAAAGLTLHGVCADVEHLPFRTGAFDGLVCDDTVEHLPDDALGVAELARILRPGGLAVVATPNRRSALVLKAKLRDRLGGRRRPASDYYAANSHLREYTWTGFEALLGRSFDIRGRIPVGWSGSRKRRLATRLISFPGVRLVSQMVVVTAEPRAR